jgi:hypothetical protein
MSASDERIILGEPISGTLLRRYAVAGTGPRREVAPRFVPPRPLPRGTTAADLARREARRHGYAAVAVGALEVSTWPN